MRSTDKIRVLMIEDEPFIRKGMADYLEDCGYEVHQAENGALGINLFREIKPDIVLTDLRMPVLGGKAVLKTLSAESPETPVIVVSGTGDILDAVQAMRAGARDYIIKPIPEMAMLLNSIERALEYADLLRQNRIYRENLESAMRIADRDMAMAVNVQKNYLPESAPVTKEWDISFVFKAMAGVSGDFYDFYEKDGNLAGVSLFDVSGHGIASGLITMLSKSIIFRNFNAFSSIPINNVMEKINDELIQEIENVDNYLTGVILRFIGDRIEYVNAAHPYVIYRPAITGKAEPLFLQDSDKNGSFLGTGALLGKFGAHEFTVNKGDCLLLYSDCLIDSFNDKEVRYGFKRLCSKISSAMTERSAADILKYLLDDFFSFTKTEILSDDLTVILMKRL